MKRRHAFAGILALFCLGLLARQGLPQENLSQLIKRIQPAVVTIIGYDANGKEIKIGSGFLLDNEGHVITCVHVISGVARAEVKMPNGMRYPLKTLVAEDLTADLVKLSVDGLRGNPAYLPISKTLPEVGDRVVVVGSPLGLEETVSDGMVSGIRIVRGRGQILQISAPVSAGSSGGPVVNLKGEVVGVAMFQMSKGQNLNFAIPGIRVLALRDGPPRPLTTQEKEVQPAQPAPPGLGPSLPPRPKVLVAPPKLQWPPTEPAPQPQ
ncbi:MAG: serine protease [Desulfobaccales bacterium]